MDRLIAANSVDIADADTAPASGTPQYATDGNPATNKAPTRWPAYQYNAIQEELIAIMTAAGIAPDKTVNSQVITSLTKLFAKNGPPGLANTAQTYTYVATDNGSAQFRTNGGAAMVDTLPGTGGFMAAGWGVTIFNNDATGLLAIVPAAGTTIDNGAAPLYLGPHQSVYVWSDGSKYWTRGKPVRALLAANTDFFVSPLGNDASPGIINTNGAQFLTIQKAVNVVAERFDLNGFTATINVADGTYTAGAQIPAVVGQPAGSPPGISIRGNTVTPTNCKVSATSACFTTSAPGTIQISGFEMTSTTDCAIACNSGGSIRQGSNRFGACATGHLIASFGATIITVDGCTIFGSSRSYASVAAGGIIYLDGIGIITAGTPAFSNGFAEADHCGNIFARSVPFSGTGATGSRYNAQANGNIDTGGGGANYFPGNSAGSISTGGNYI